MLRLLVLLLAGSLCAVAHAERVVTLSPHATELVWFAGGGDQLVGVSAFSDFPQQVRKLPVIGDATGIDRERLMSLQPDLLVFWSNGIKPPDLDWLEKRGIATFSSNPVTIDGLIDEIRTLGELLGTAKTAEESIATIERRREQLAGLGRGERIRLIHQLWNRPLIVLGKRDLLSHTLALCGIDNPVGIGDLPSASVSHEYLHAIDADAILIGDDALFEPFNPRHLPVYRGDSSRLHRATPRLLDAALQVCREIRSGENRAESRASMEE